MDNFGVADLVSALEEEEEEVRGIVEGLSHGYDEDDPATTSTPHHPKTFPLKTSKQRSSNRKAKTAAAAAAASNPGIQQKRSPRKEANSTDEDEESTSVGLHKSPPRLPINNNNNNSNNNNTIIGGIQQESVVLDKSYVKLKTSPLRSDGGVKNEMGDSDDNITERLSSSLSLQSDLLMIGSVKGCVSSPPAASKICGRSFESEGNAGDRKGHGQLSSTISTSKQEFQPIPGPSSGCCHSAGGRKFGGGGSPPPLHYSLKDLPLRPSHRRRRRRRGHVNSTKRMAVDNNSSPPPNEVEMEEGASGGRGRNSTKASPSYRKVTVTHEEKKKKGGLLEGTLIAGVDRFGMKRKRNLIGCFNRVGLPHGNGVALSSSCPESSGLGEECCGIDDEEMKSEDEEDDSEYYSTSGDDEKGEDDRGREADDEQSDWVFDEWSTNTSSASGGSGGDRNEGESAICRRRRLMKMLRNYKSMISAGRDNTHNHQQLSGDGKTGTLVSREILAGKRRVLAQPTTDFPASRSIWTSANEEVSKFLQDPKQSQIKLQPIPAEERVGLSHLASLYSLHMDYCSNDEGSQDRDLVERTCSSYERAEEDSMMTEQQKLYPVLTKTPNTTQMNEKAADALNFISAGDFHGLFASQENTRSAIIIPPSEVSSLHTSCSSSSFGALERSYCPTISYSDVDSVASDTKRVKK